MSESARCPQCGTELPEETPQGLCPTCLLKLGLSGAVPAFQEPPSSPPRRRRRLIAFIAVLGAAALGAAVSIWPRRPSPRPFVVRFNVPLPEDASFAVSPDGKQLAYSALGRLWLRRL